MNMWLWVLLAIVALFLLVRLFGRSGDSSNATQPNGITSASTHGNAGSGEHSNEGGLTATLGDAAAIGAEVGSGAVAASGGIAHGGDTVSSAGGATSAANSGPVSCSARKLRGNNKSQVSLA